MTFRIRNSHWCAMVCAVALVCAGIATAQPVEALPSSAQLLSWTDDQGERREVDTVEAWRARRPRLLAGLEQAMGPLPRRENLPPLDVRFHQRESRDGVEILSISYQAEAGDRVPALLLLPTDIAAAQRRPAALALHQTTPLGKREPAGLGSRDLAYALELAQRGYVAIAPDYPSFGDYDYDFAADDYVSGTMKGVFNHMRAVDLLCQRDDVDPKRVAVIGHSLGGHNAMFVAAFDERLRAVVSSCGWCPFHDYYAGDMRGWTSDRYMPRLRDEFALDPDRAPFDFYAVAALLAPRPFFSNSPVGDENFAVEGVRKAAPVVRGVYALFGEEGSLDIRYPDCEHAFPPDMRRAAYAFLDREFGHTPPPEKAELPHDPPAEGSQPDPSHTNDLPTNPR